jgi:hypothetical protein
MPRPKRGLRSLRQALHWLFLAVGAVAAAALIVSVSTYLDYARGGYGVSVSLSDIELEGTTLRFAVTESNPGKLELATWGQGILRAGEGTGGHGFYLAMRLEAEASERAVIAVDLTPEEADALRSGGTFSVSLPLSVSVEERDLVTEPKVYTFSSLGVAP